MPAASRLEPDRLDAAAELRDFIVGREADGAVVSFTGLARSRTSAGAPLATMRLDWYPGMTERSLATIAADGLARFDVSEVSVVHRCGVIQPGEAIVFVVVAAPHRREAFLAADYLMDRLKTEAAFWKREEGPDGGAWIEPTDNDRADLARWSA